MRYLWKVPLQMRNDKLVAVLGEEPHTPIDEAVKASLAAIGCLPARMRRAVRSWSSASAIRATAKSDSAFLVSPSLRNQAAERPA